MENKVFVIAEIGVNHNGDYTTAKKMIDIAAEAGADAVKLQVFSATALASRHAAKAEYQKNGHDDQNQVAMLEKLALSHKDHRKLQEQSQQLGIEYIASPFDHESLEFLLSDLQVKTLKFGSGELTNGPLLLRAARSEKPLILSTGMAKMTEIREALGVLAFGYANKNAPNSRNDFTEAFANSRNRRQLKQYVTLLHCTSAYPSPLDEINLRAMDTLRDAFNLPVGYSDHSNGITVSIAAAARGATIIEKHFTLDRTQDGPDHAASIEPEELAALVGGIRVVQQALGGSVKIPTKSENSNTEATRKSLVAAKPIAAGENFTEDNLTAKRPGTGRSPLDFWNLLGLPAGRDYAADELID